MSSPTPPDRTVAWSLLIAVSFAILCTFVLAGVGTYYYTVTSQRGVSTQKVAKLRAPSSALAGALGAASVQREDAREQEEAYEPSSEWAEPWAKSDRTEFTMGEAEGAAPASNLPSRLEDDRIQRIILEHQNDLIECYADGLQEDPDLEGQVQFHFRIASDGKVAMVKVTGSELEDHPTEDCFVDSARRWRFPKSQAKLTKFDTHFDFYAD